MREMPWSGPSRRELGVLVLAVAAALATVVVVRVVAHVWGRRDVALERQGEQPPLPARMDVNTAEAYELEMLPGIGPKTAQAIVDYRREHGPFASLEELTRVRGVGEVTVEAMRPHVMCVPPSARRQVD